MSELIDEVCKLIDKLSDEEKLIVLAYLRARVPRHELEDKWGTTADLILTAIARSPDLTLRGVRGILAEATFELHFVPKLEADGWTTAVIVGDKPYDFLLQKDSVTQVKIQVKLQRSKSHSPLEYLASTRKKKLNCPHAQVYVVEVQKTRGGKKGG